MARSFLFFCIASVLLSCKSNKPSSSISEIETDTELKVFIEQSAQIFPDPKRTSDVASLIALSGASYDPGLHNDVTRAESYLSNPILAAANCGVYTADVVYHTVFEMHDSAFSSLTGAKILALEMGFGPLYIENLIKRYEDGITKEDSILFKLDQVLATTEMQLSDQQRLVIMSAMLTGNFVEKQYLLHRILEQSLELAREDKIDNLKLKQFLVIVLKQQASYKQLVSYFETYSDPNSPGVFLQELRVASDLSDKLFSEENPDEMQLEAILNSDNLDKLRNQIYRMRKMIVENSLPVSN